MGINVKFLVSGNHSMYGAGMVPFGLVIAAFGLNEKKKDKKYSY